MISSTIENRSDRVATRVTGHGSLAGSSVARRFCKTFIVFETIIDRNHHVLHRQRVSRIVLKPRLYFRYESDFAAFL